MAQDRSQVAIAPFLALCKSANSPRAASDLIIQAINVSGTYTFAELLAHPNIAALKSDKQYAAHFTLLEVFSWGTWETYTSKTNLPKLSDPQALKLRLLSLLSYAAEKNTDLSYKALCSRLQLSSAVDLEHLVTTAIYSDLLKATLNPATQTVQITSVAPVRDLAPGSIQEMLQELEQWSERCDSVLADLKAEITKVKAAAEARAAKQAKMQRQLHTATEMNEKMNLSAATRGLSQSGAHRPPRNQRDEHGAGEDDEPFLDDDAMDIDNHASTAKRKAASGFLGRFKGR